MGSHTGQRGRTHRLKREELVMEVFSLISEEYERSDKETIWDICVPLSTIRMRLSERHDTHYSSDQWLQTQLKRYEDEMGVRLFQRTKDHAGTGTRQPTLSLVREMVDFYQKQHLYVTEKIKVANGAYDFVSRKHLSLPGRPNNPDLPCSILLGAGSTVYHLATLFAQGSHREERRYRIYTHNAGFMQKLLNSSVNFARVSLVALGGELEPVTRTLLSTNLDQVRNEPLDFVVQGTSCVCDGMLYIESSREAAVKSSILHECPGCKLLVCTKHEFSEQPLPNTEPYGKLTDYDYVVVPHSPDREPHKPYEKVFHEHRTHLEPEILNWSYAVHRVVK